MLNLFETHPIELYHLTIVTADGRRERLGTTGNHPFYEASERRFVPARELRPGCRVVTVTGAIAEVEAVEVHTAAAGESFTTYNIEVEEDHTSHVGEPGTWVHNLTKEECLALVKRVADGDETAILPLRKGLAEKPELRELVPEEWLRRVDAPPKVRPLVNSTLPCRVTQELPAGEMRTPAEVAQARNFFERNREVARKWWSERNGGKPWPADSVHDSHPRSLKGGGDPLFIEPSYDSPIHPHMIPQPPDGLTDFQRWGRLGGRPRN